MCRSRASFVDGCLFSSTAASSGGFFFENRLLILELINYMDIQTINTYNKMAFAYDNETVDFWDRFPKTIFDKFIELTKGRVLDVGSGPGRDGLILKNAGLDVVCIDASEEMVKLSLNRGLNSIVGDFNDLPFDNKSFDGIWGIHFTLTCSEARSRGKHFLRLLG
jgi:SAM-dependent methyltransferase